MQPRPNLLTREHFERAINDIVAHGDNDVLPFDVDTRFISDCKCELATIGHELAQFLENKDPRDVISTIDSYPIFFERLLAPSGHSGFRTTTKIHSFWNIYLNAACLAIAGIHEPKRHVRAHSYRLATSGDSLFDRTKSWRAFRQATLEEMLGRPQYSVVAQTDVSGFYDHVYHHRLENFVRDILPSGSNIDVQIDRLLNKLAAGRSFGLPVGGQAARILAEIVMASVDRSLEAHGISWHRYVDDFVIYATDHTDAYRCLSVLAHALADFGLGLNRSKTTILSASNYMDLVTNQLRSTDPDSQQLMDIDLHFDPYSDTAEEDYEALRSTIDQLDVARLLRLELDKGQPDSFVVSQVSRALRLVSPQKALLVCKTLMDARNLHAFRASWSTIMRGIAAARDDSGHAEIAKEIDEALDLLPQTVPHLLLVDTNCLHYLRTLRTRRTERRAHFVLDTYDRSKFYTIRRACIDCWRNWQDRERFIALRNRWQTLGPEEQRLVWLAAASFGDDGMHFRKQERATIKERWKLGIETGRRSTIMQFADVYAAWADDQV